MNAIVAVNDGIEDCFAEGIYGILRFIRAGAGFFADNGFDLHIPTAEIQRFLHHFSNGSADSLVVDKPCGILIYIADFRARHNNCRNTKLWEEPLWVKAKIQNCCQGRNTVSCNVQHLHGLLLCQSGKSRSVHTHFFNIAVDLFCVQQLQRRPLNGSLIIMQMLTERFIAV